MQIDCHDFANAKSRNDDSNVIPRKTRKSQGDSIESNADSSYAINSEILSILNKPINAIKDELLKTNSCAFLPQLYGIWDSIDAIDFEALPQSFVLKTNHDCGGVVLVKDKSAFLNDKIALKNALDKLRKHLATNYYTLCREYHYKDIEPKIFAEEMLSQDLSDPTTYKFHIFGRNDENNFIQVTTDRFSSEYQRSIFTPFWELTPFGLGGKNENLKHIPQCPQTLKEMYEIAQILASEFDYVRVDLYEADYGEDKAIFVGELTFTPMGGTDRFYPSDYDLILGGAWRKKEAK